jgi:glycine/D-amino acid oxidase-like deaminating enzyme
MEPLLPETVLGAFLSPSEHNVQGRLLTQAYVRGARLRGAHIFEGRLVGRFLQQG